MMNTPSMYSVEQLLKARQDGIPDYVVVPMLQKAMAQKQAMAQQQALQQGMNPPPPVADQILDAAHQSVMQDYVAESKPQEPRGIESLPSGIDEEDYAGGGIIAFADGGDTPYQVNDEDYADRYTGSDLDPNAQRDKYLSSIGTNPAIAKQEERIGAREASLKSEEENSPWMALMQAGLATMAGTSPNALTNIGEGASKGLAAYGESKKAIAGRMDKLDELRSRMEEAHRAEAVAAANFGFNSVERKEAANEKRALAKQAAKLEAGLGADKYYMNKEDNAAAMQRANIAAGSSAAHLAETIRHNKAVEGGMGGVGGKPMTANQQKIYNYNQYKVANAELKAAIEDGDPALIAGARESYNDAYEAYMGRPAPKAGEKPPEEPGMSDYIRHPIDAWNGKLPGQKPSSGGDIKLPDGTIVKRLG